MSGLEAAGNHGPNAVQGSILKQRTVEVLQHTLQSSNMIKKESSEIVAFDERNSTLQK